MNQNITNTDDRRLSMAYFAGLFLLVVALSCFAFTRSYQLQKEIPKMEMERLVAKEQVMKNLSKLSELIRQYETEQLSGSNYAEAKDAEIAEELVTIRRQLLHVDTVVAYNDIKKILDMATQYRNFIKRTAKEGGMKTLEYEKQIAELQTKVNASDLDKKSAQIQMQEQQLLAAKKNSGGGSTAPPAIIYAPPAAAPSPSQPLVIPTPHTGNADCDGQINQIKTGFKNMCSQMRNTIGEIRLDVNSISRGIINANKKEKQRIESNLMKLDKQLEASLIN